MRKLFLADANNDGKTDFNMILEKEDGCHWFIYGWRRDSWQPYWDSSEIYPPIIDIEEVNSGKFLILEKEEDGARNLTLWRWDEWGHKLIDEKKDIDFSEIERAADNVFLLR